MLPLSAILRNWGEVEDPAERSEGSGVGRSGEGKFGESVGGACPVPAQKGVFCVCASGVGAGFSVSIE